MLEEAAEKGNEAAEFALDAFAYRVAKYVGSYAVVLEGMDALVFSGGIGEHSESMRQRICARLSLLGIQTPKKIVTIDGVSCLSGESTPSIWVVPTDEERQIANETLAVISVKSA